MEFGPGYTSRQFPQATSFDFPLRRHASVELEVSSFPPETFAVATEYHASVHVDGSVRGPNPYELSTTPRNGNDFEVMIDALCQSLNEHQATVNSSCGFHVHVDARDLCWLDIKKVTRLWSIVEPALFGMVPPSRQHNQYTVPCAAKFERIFGKQRSEQAVENRVAVAEYGSVREYQACKRNHYWGTSGDPRSRYAALNLHSWVYRGTLEIRLHNGTTDARKIKNWTLLCAGLVDFATSHTFTQIKRLYGGPFKVLLRVARKAGGRQLVRWTKRRLDKFSPGWDVQPTAGEPSQSGGATIDGCLSQSNLVDELERLQQQNARETTQNP